MDHEPLWSRHGAERDGLEIGVSTQAAINPVLVRNRVPLMRSVRARNTGEHPQADGIVAASLHDRGSELADPTATGIDADLAAGHEFALGDLATSSNDGARYRTGA